MSLNKKILALAIAGLLPGASIASAPGALGEVDLQLNPVNTTVFANEISEPGTDLEGGGLAEILDVKTELGFSIVGSSKYVRLDYPDTDFDKPLTATNFHTELAGGGAPALPGTLTISAGGTATSKFVIVEIAGAQLSNLDKFVFDLEDNQVPVGAPANVVKVRPLSKGPHNILFRLYDTATQAANPLAPGSLPLATYSGTWYDFGVGFKISCAPVASTKIDISDPDHFVDGTLESPIFKLNADGTGVYRETGALVTIGDYIPATSEFTMTGNVLNILGPAGDVTLDGTSGALTNTTAKWTVPAPALPYAGETVKLFSDGTLNLLPGDYSVSLDVKGTPALELPSDPYPLGTCGSLAYSGSTDRVDFVVTPGNPNNKQWFRITNPSEKGGAVAVSVWNDAGIRVDFPLSTVKTTFGTIVNLPNDLPAGGSTPVVSVDSFITAAQSVNPAFTVGTGVDGQPGKLRIEVRGAFGDDEVDGVHGINTSVPDIDTALALINGRPTTGRLKKGIYIQSILQGGVTQSH